MCRILMHLRAVTPLLALLLGSLMLPFTFASVVVADAGAAAFHPRYAYVTVHYEGTPSDDEYVLGVRVLVQSIMLNAEPGADVDVLVLCSTEVRQESKDAFTALGAKTLPVEHVAHAYESGLHETYKPRFVHAMNKLQLWSLTQYERIIYLDADCVVVRSMSILFHSAAFGAVMNMNGFIHTGLLVIKPDMAMHAKLLAAVSSTWSRDGADQGFLISMFNDNIEDAPNFNPMSVEAADRDFANLPFNRIKVNFDLPAIYWYERFSWATLRAVHPAFVSMDVPAYAVTYSMGELLKPWYWYAYPLLEMNSLWLGVRMQLPGEASTWHWAAGRRFVLLAVFYALLWALDRRWRGAVKLSSSTSSSSSSGSGSSSALLASGSSSSGGSSGGSGSSSGEKSFMASAMEAFGYGCVAAAFLLTYCALLPSLAPGLMPPRDAYALGFGAYPLAVHLAGLACGKVMSMVHGQVSPLLLPPPGLCVGPTIALACFYMGMGYHPWYDMGTGVPPAARTITLVLLGELNVVAMALYLRLAADPRRLGPSFARDKALRLPR